jgi:hypothetical protein
VADELEKSGGAQNEEVTAEGAERPTVSPPFDPAAFARDVLSTPSPAKGTPAVSVDAHTHATPPQGIAQQAAIVELSRASNPPATTGKKTLDAAAPPEPAPDSIGSIAKQKLPSNELPRIDLSPNELEGLSSSFSAVDREWEELEMATRPPPADAPDEDPVLEVMNDSSTSVNLVDLDDIEQLEAPTKQRDKLPSLPEEAAPRAATPAPTPIPAPRPPSKKPPPGEREMNDRVSVGDYSGALEIAESILAEKPNDPVAKACADNCKQVLRKMYAARIGPLDRVPSVAVARDQLRWLSIDHKAGFVLSLVDGVSSLEMIIDVSGMPELDTLRILSELAQQRIISLR